MLLPPTVAVIPACLFLVLHQSSAPAKSAQALSTSQDAFYGSAISPRADPLPAASSSPDNHSGPNQISSYDDQQRWKTYLTIQKLFERLWLHPLSKKTIKTGNVATFKDFPVLELEDRDGDGRADFYSYDRPDRRGMTQEFGAFFDLNGDGRPDWIVIYGGLFFTKNMKLLMWYHNAIDTNGDGKFDVTIYTLIDMDGDGFPEEGATTWVYDTNYDGLVDKADYIIDGHVTPITPKNGVLPLHYLMNTDPGDQPKIGGPMPVQLFADIANDIAVISNGRRAGN